MSRPKPDPRDPEYLAYAHLFNDITAAPSEQYVRLSTRHDIADHLFALGYRRRHVAKTETGAPWVSFQERPLPTDTAVEVHGYDIPEEES